MIFETLCILLGLIISANCDPRLKIVNGNVANISDFPFMASILYKYGELPIEFECGAAILDEKTILTAGHCCPGMPNYVDLVRIGVGNTNFTQATLMNVSMCIAFEEFVFEPPFRHDIALCKLAKPLTFNENVQPIQLPRQKDTTPEGKKTKISGWGWDHEPYGHNTDLLNELDVVFWSDDACEEIWANMTTSKFNVEFSLASNRTIQLCAKYPEEVLAGTCYGDSGSPLTVDGVLYGVTSYMNPPCGNTQYPVVYTRVSHYLDWIIPKMG